MKSPTKLQYNSGKSSRSIISKSSRLTKNIVPQQKQKKIVLPYFQGDQIRKEIMNRLHQPSNSSSKQNQHLKKAENIISDLMQRHKKAKERLRLMKEENEKQFQKAFSFTPQIQSNSERYQVKGDVIRRNQIWLREKKKKILQIKEEVIMQSLKECTFSPTFQSKKKSESYLRKRSVSRSLTPKSRRNDYNTLNHLSPLKESKNHQSKKDYTKEQYQTAKRNLITRMMNISY